MSKVTNILIFIILTFLFFYFFVSPKYQEFQDLTVQTREKKAEEKFQKEYFDNIIKIAEELKEYEEEISKIDSAIPIRPFLPSLFFFLSETATQNGLILKNIEKFSVSIPREGSGIREIVTDISFVGLYPSLKSFLSELESSSRIIGVENIKFSEPKDKDENRIFDFNLKIKTYSY